MMDEFNLYNGFIDDNTFATLPYFKIDESDEDIYIEWNVGNRLDILAYKYFQNAALWKFILLANPQYLCEGDINIGDILRIPITKENMFSIINRRVDIAKRF
jgi:hypothetical protein